MPLRGILGLAGDEGGFVARDEYAEEPQVCARARSVMERSSLFPGAGRATAI